MFPSKVPEGYFLSNNFAKIYQSSQSINASSQSNTKNKINYPNKILHKRPMSLGSIS